MKKILYRLFIVVSLFIITLNILSILHIPLFGFRIFRVGTGSMVPYLNTNDYILVEETDKYEEGDVVTYKVGDNVFITHRIINIDGNKITTKGDANNISDDPITFENIIGKVVFKVGVFGFVIYLFSKPLSWILLFMIGFAITMSIPDQKSKKKIARKKKELNTDNKVVEAKDKKKSTTKKKATRKTNTKELKPKKKEAVTKKAASKKTTTAKKVAEPKKKAAIKKANTKEIKTTKKVASVKKPVAKKKTSKR